MMNFVAFFAGLVFAPGCTTANEVPTPGPEVVKEAENSATATDVNVVRNISGGVITGGTPPGMVEVPAGKAVLGIETDHAIELIQENSASRETQNIISGCSPQFEIDVPAFFVDTHEVTNLQYKNYLKEASRKCPAYLADISWNYYDRDKKEEIRGTFDPKTSNNALGGIKYSDAQRYADFFGRRLLTEAEWSRAARGDQEDNLFAWGKEWSRKKNACGSNERGIVATVMKYPEDVSWCGVFDMMGNVMEWTSSKYEKYPGFEPIKIEKRSRDRFMAGFSSLHYVVRGGSVEGNELSNNAFMRQGFKNGDFFQLIGFRTAKSYEPGRDLLQRAVNKDLILTGAQREENELAWHDIGGQEFFTSEEVDGITMVKESHGIAFGHPEKIKLSKSRFKKNSIEDPIFIGVVTSTKPIANPELPAGSYAVFYKAEGVPKGERSRKKKDKKKDEGDKEEETTEEETTEDEESDSEDEESEEEESLVAEEGEEEPEEEPLEIPEVEYPRDKDVFLIKAGNGAVVAWVPAPEIREDKSVGCQFSYGMSEGKEVARYAFSIDGANSRRSFHFEFAFEFALGSFQSFTPEVAGE